MKWQVKYALKNFEKESRVSTEYVSGDVIRIMTDNQPDVLAAIKDIETVNQETAELCLTQTPKLDFLCGYRNQCVWEGEAIRHLEFARVGWGSFGTLRSAVLEGNANSAAHKTYKFCDRALRQCSDVVKVERKFDRIYQLTLRSDTSLRLGMIADYEPTADSVRTLWERFGAVDIIWNINPNGSPTFEACEVGRELGCEVMKWNNLKEHLKKA